MSTPTIMLASGKQVKLGCLLPSTRVMTDRFILSEYPDGTYDFSLRLNHYYDPRLDASPPPAATNWRQRAMPSIQRMYDNDTYGCCVISSAYHQVGLWTANDTTQNPNPACVVGTDQEVLSTYRIWNPGSQDNGCVISTVLDYTRDHGVLLGGVTHKIDGHVAIDWTNQLMVQVAIEVFGSVKLGINLPQAWEQAPDGGTWDVTNSTVVGGHDVPAIDYDSNGVWIATWGGTRLITWPAFLSKRWLMEAHVPLSPDWYGNDAVAANGINKAKLADDLAKIGQGVIPDPGPQPPGPTPVPPTPVPPTPVPPSPTDTITLTQAVKAGQFVRFKTAKPAGVYVRQSGTTRNNVVEAE